MFGQMFGVLSALVDARANKRAAEIAMDGFRHQVACQLASGGWNRPNGTVKRIKGEWRAVFEAPTRIPQHPRKT